MYYQHYGLRFPPFKITPDTTLFFSGGHRGLLLEALLYALDQGEGIVKVVGEVGSGKTMLCRMLIERLPKQVDIAYLANPHLTPDTILQAIALELRLPEPAHRANSLQVMHTLQQHLLNTHAQNRKTVVLVEEAQGMPVETLEEIRLLSNLETGRDKLLQIVLFGQPELDENLNRNHIRQLRERITHHFYLEPLKSTEIAAYIDFRLRSAGYQGPALFSVAVIKAIAKASNGLLRRVNILADKALLASFNELAPQITLRHVRIACQDARLHDPPRAFSWHWIRWLVLAGLWLTLIGWLGWHSNYPNSTLIIKPAPPFISASPKEPTEGVTKLLLEN